MKRITLSSMVLLLIVSGILAGCSQPAPSGGAPSSGDKVADAFKGKTMTIHVSASPGGGADTFARLTANHLPERLGLEAVMVVNEDQASGMVARNQVFKNTPADGLHLLADPIGAQWPAWALDVTGVDYDVTKFKYIAAVKGAGQVLIVDPNGPYSTVEGLRNAKEEIRFSSTTAGSLNALAPLATIEILGLNGKVITGYKGSAERILAIKRGEVIGAFVPLETALERKNEFKMLFLVSAERSSDYLDIPCLGDVIELTDYHKSLLSAIVDDGRLIAAPPNTPDETVKYLRDKVTEIFNDAKFQEDVKKAGTPWIGFWTGEELAARATKLAQDKKVYLDVYKELSAKLIK
ncbi:MAG TPA: tripartite tricarboxylate transporter substrate-binding protein [Anaerolineae bacterium]|nr:tripartite tricarboxylate transporter substrate-binding protein [Anaerolineae bacterium]HOQ98062.1 tripartite tricarboxylate transporter substrate-binding protein [Anaerolineae bacterium]HPL28050.1 tripartite tricarboxylate transporter substrate-binding protein [Anaerolineae bacterium]